MDILKAGKSVYMTFVSFDIECKLNNSFYVCIYSVVNDICTRDRVILLYNALVSISSEKIDENEAVIQIMNFPEKSNLRYLAVHELECRNSSVAFAILEHKIKILNELVKG